MLEADTGWYMLGERTYSPALRRFIAPDASSPFDGGGVNRHAYCGGDPVNRIDPSGHTWLGWAGASLGISAPAGAARSVSPAPRMQETATTPVTVTTTAAAVVDAVSITSAIDSVALMTADRPNSRGIFGWTGMASKTGAGGPLPAARNGASSERFMGQQRAITRRHPVGVKPKRTVDVVTAPHIPAHRMTTDRSGEPAVAREWTVRPHNQNQDSVIWATDSEVANADFRGVFRRLNTSGVTRVNVYTGAHGDPWGENWHLRTGERLDPVPQFYISDLVHTKKAAKRYGMTINVVNMAVLNKQDMQHHLLQDGVHLIGSCFGLSDEVVMEALNIQQATVYLLV